MTAAPPTVTSSDGVEVVLHDLGGDGPPVLCSHATGFHGRCWEPMAEHLTDRFHVVALDYRGHGDTRAPHDWRVDWERYGDDALAAASALDGTGPLLAVGHSMGGACLLMAAHREPARFAGLVLFEPIVFPPELVRDDAASSPLAMGARRRRSSFPSTDDAIANYAAKPPMNAFTPAALRAYVEHGFRDGDDGEVHLKCSPEHEARTFEAGGLHRTWEVLERIEVPVRVVAGRVDAGSPSAMAAGIAERLPHGSYLELDQLDHFGPMTHPDRLARLVLDLADELGC